MSAFAKNIVFFVFVFVLFFFTGSAERGKKRGEQMMFPARLTVNLLRLLREFQSKQFDSSRGR